jgi:S-DNA-T family DNA segregation ATPase FtsK/SpoIIIE
MINDAHALAEWVATYDELLDKRQLQHNDITVVRYRRALHQWPQHDRELDLRAAPAGRAGAPPALDELNLQLDASDEFKPAADKAKRCACRSPATSCCGPPSAVSPPAK